MINPCSHAYTQNDARAYMIINALVKYTTDMNLVKGLGFCVSKEHAEYMALIFNRAAIPAMFLTSDSPEEYRSSAKKRLIDGEIHFIFVVDLYNEGVDIPEINTVLFLRPTESLTVFLQQLGRGLRLSKDKECLTVLDFIGQANKKYNFEDKFKALLEITSKNVKREIKDGFISLPKGCYIQLEKKAQTYILSNISASFGDKKGIIARISNFLEDTGKELSLANFLDYYHLDIRQIYCKGSFSRLCVLAGIKAEFSEELEDTLTTAIGKICAINSRRWIHCLLELLPHIESASPSPDQYRMLNMLHFTIFTFAEENVISSLSRLKNNPIMFAEIMDILHYSLSHIDFVDEQIELGYDCPLDVQCDYTRDQILVAMDFMKPNSVREGVKYLPEKNTDLLFVTLNKSDKDYSPSTMYNDYSINERLFHWQSQSTTSPESTTGLRYCTHKKNNGKVLLFVREFKTDMIKTAPYTFLGPCNFVKSEGSKPMNIIWELEKEIPIKFLKKTRKMII